MYDLLHTTGILCIIIYVRPMYYINISIRYYNNSIYIKVENIQFNIGQFRLLVNIKKHTNRKIVLKIKPYKTGNN